MNIASTTSPSIAFQNRQQVGHSQNSDRPASAETAPSPSSAAPDQTKQSKPSSSSSDSPEQAVQQVNNAFLEKQQQLIASIEKDSLTGISVFKIMDKSTNEVVRQLPVKEAVSFAQSLAVPEGWRGQLVLDQI